MRGYSKVGIPTVQRKDTVLYSMYMRCVTGIPRTKWSCLEKQIFLKQTRFCMHKRSKPMPPDPDTLDFQRAADRQWRRGVDNMLRARYASKAEADARRQWQDYLQRRSVIYFKTCMGGERPPTLPGDAELPVLRSQSPPKWKPPPRAATVHPRPFLGPNSSKLIYGTRPLDGGNPHYNSPLRPSSSSSGYLMSSMSMSSSLASIGTSGTMSVWQGNLAPGSKSPTGDGTRQLQRTHSSFAMLRPETIGRPKRRPTPHARELPRVGSAADAGLGQWGVGWGWTLADAECEEME